MRTFRFVRLGLIAAVFASLILALGTGRNAQSKQPGLDPYASTSIEITAGEAPASPGNGTYYTVHPDLRRCASPLCGGYFVSRVNQQTTRCANGSWRRECYVAEIDWNGAAQVEGRGALLRGNVIAKKFPPYGNLGAFRVSESWQAASDKQPTGLFYRVRDRGVRCITHPCLTHVATRLNSGISRNIAGVDLEGAGANGDLVSRAAAAMTEAAGVLVAGNTSVVTGPGGRAQTLKASQFYLRAEGTSQLPSSDMKPCIKTGCSGELCTDQNMASPCIYRPEFACYQKAVCERQSDGACGFTRTPELTACLSKR